MKKLLIFICMILCSCRSLPADTSIYKAPKLKKYVYEYQFKDNAESLVEKNIYHAHSNAYFTMRVIQELDKNIDETLSNNTKIGTVVIRNTGGVGDTFESFLWEAPSFLTLGIINLAGYPAGHVKANVNVFANVYDSKGNLIKKYSADGSDSAIQACYYGYSYSTAKILSLSRAYKEALSDVLKQIDNDEELYMVSTGVLKKKLIEQKEQEAMLKEKQKQEEALKINEKKHLNSVLQEVDNL